MGTKTNIALAIGALLALPVGCAAYSTFSSVVSAPSRVINKTLQTDNIIFNYEAFFDQNAQFQSRKDQVAQYKKFLESETNPDEKIRLRTEFGAMQQSCRDLVNKYNNDSQKLNKSLFKSKNLPTELDITSCG